MTIAVPASAVGIQPRTKEVMSVLRLCPLGTLLLDGWQVLSLNQQGWLNLKSIADFTKSKEKRNA